MASDFELIDLDFFRRRRFRDSAAGGRGRAPEDHPPTVTGGEFIGFDLLNDR